MNLQPRFKKWIAWGFALAADGLALALRIPRTIGAPLVRLVRLAGLRGSALGSVPVTTQFDGPIRTTPTVRLSLGEHCRLGRDVFFETQGDGQIKLGDHVRINRGCVLVSYSKISVGDDCLIGEYVSIRDADHGMAPDRAIRAQPHTTRPIEIGNDVWIGRGTMILNGVKIGSGAVVGANSVVTRDVPPMTIAGGVPARILKRRDLPVVGQPSHIRLEASCQNT